jgi:hypothetical protein
VRIKHGHEEKARICYDRDRDPDGDPGSSGDY